mgnify:CR=1 FL=1
MLEQRIQQHFIDSADLKYQSAEALSKPIAAAVQAILVSVTSGGKVLACGNGGSASDAQHFAAEFVGRFLQHVLPAGFKRIRHYGLLANCNRTTCLALARQLLQVPLQDPLSSPPCDDSQDTARPSFVCAHCGHAMVVLQVFLRDCSIRAPPAP